MSTTTLIRGGALAIAAAGLAAAAWTGTAIGHASTESQAVCSVLDKYPNDVGVSMVVMTMLNNGYTADSGPEALVGWVQGSCPQHMPALSHWADTVTQ